MIKILVKSLINSFLLAFPVWIFDGYTKGIFNVYHLIFSYIISNLVLFSNICSEKKGEIYD
jgi:hypothetical protein